MRQSIFDYTSLEINLISELCKARGVGSNDSISCQTVYLLPLSMSIAQI